MLVNEHRSSSTLGCLLQSLPPTSRWSISASIIFLFFVAPPAVCGADHGAEAKRPAVLRVAITFHLCLWSVMLCHVRIYEYTKCRIFIGIRYLPIVLST